MKASEAYAVRLNPAPAQTCIPPEAGALDRLAAAGSALHDCLERLEHKLSGVLTPTPPSEACQGIAGTTGLRQLISSIEGARARLTALTDRIDL